MREGETVEILADFAHERAGRVEFVQLRRCRAVHRRALTGPREHEHVPLGIQRDADDFTEMFVGRQLERFDVRIEADLGDGHRCSGVRGRLRL